MARDFNQMPVHAAIAAIANDFHSRGWMAGTAGNLSARSEDGEEMWITSSGLPKGQLNASDLILMGFEGNDIQQRLRDDARPSAETSIHQTIYTLFPSAQACFHVHSVDACLAAAKTQPQIQAMLLPPLEMIKGLDIWEESPQVTLALFDNQLHVPNIANEPNQIYSH